MQLESQTRVNKYIQANQTTETTGLGLSDIQLPNLKVMSKHATHNSKVIDFKIFIWT